MTAASVAKTIEVINGSEVCITRRPGKPLILLVRMASRGLGGWDGIWDFLANHFTVAQFDLKMPSVEALEQPLGVFKSLAHDCVAMAEALGHKSFHMFGWTGGAHVALRASIDFPDRVR